MRSIVDFLRSNVGFFALKCRTNALKRRATFCTGQMQARNDRDFRKSSINPACCKQIDSSPKIKMLENCYVCFYKFINGIISYLLFFHNEHIII